MEIQRLNRLGEGGGGQEDGAGVRARVPQPLRRQDHVRHFRLESVCSMSVQTDMKLSVIPVLCLGKRLQRPSNR